ncbi:conserved exported hypothetical protein [Nitrospina gracilis 3/211]|uniref:Uncharacterized protein n=1 Tax=Nitrospina gracilis (strain 3/211) TaxID=1266370 RepID=M1Z857_NITG3|nr:MULTISPECIES: hypothetical protein [Nitrospina]MCF8722338.1 TolA-binding protein [Nitrospina sp. Nb-3]CCQ89177.1 conserved exported hypothetical protein [Nitrospina gracilis 3/211]
MSKLFATRISYIAILSVLFLALGVAAPSLAESKAKDKTTTEDIGKRFDALTESIKNYSAQEKDEAVAEVESNLDYLDRRIDALQNKADRKMGSMSAEAKKELNEKLKALKRERDEVQKWLGEMKRSSKDAWGDITDGFSDATSRLGKAFDQASDAFSKKR